MTQPRNSALQKFRPLDTPPPDFGDKLGNVLQDGWEYAGCEWKLEGGDLTWLVDYVDKALDLLEPSSNAFRKCSRELERICGANGMLPTSCMPSSQSLNIDAEPFASGGFSRVFRGTLDGSRVCIKQISVSTKDPAEKATKTFCEEVIMWKRLTHPNIIPLLGAIISPRLQLISDWMSGGELPEYINKHPDQDRLVLLVDVAQGLHYLHSRNVIHGDLKGANILVDDSGHARITDFGLSMVTSNLDSKPSTTYQRYYTVGWAAPEVMENGGYSKESDMFSFAMVMVEVFTGTAPFNNKPHQMVRSFIIQGSRPERPAHLSFTGNLWSLMQRCWDGNPGLRPNASESLKILSIRETPAWKQLITLALTKEKRISLITEIFSDKSQARAVRELSGGDAQSFIDETDKVLDDLAPQIHRECLQYLTKICSRQTLLPSTLQLPLLYDPMENPVERGVFANLRKGQYNGQVVAVMVLNVYERYYLDRVASGFCAKVIAWRGLYHPNVIPLLGVIMNRPRFAMVSQWMPKGSIREYTEAHASVDRLELLSGVTRGLIYMHGERVIHGDLKAENILIDDDGQPRLAGFTSVRMESSDQTFGSSQAGEAGTVRWMSPELLDPEAFDLKDWNPTMKSDCYALGMVIYEVLSGHIPFAKHSDYTVIIMVARGERPKRPRGYEGRWFTDEIWRVLEHCWEKRPDNRPNAEGILTCLEGSPPPPLSPLYIGEDTDTDHQLDTPMSELIAAPETVAQNDDEPCSLPSTAELMTPQDGDQLQGPLRISDPNGEGSNELITWVLSGLLVYVISHAGW